MVTCIRKPMTPMNNMKKDNLIGNSAVNQLRTKIKDTRNRYWTHIVVLDCNRKSNIVVGSDVALSGTLMVRPGLR